LDNLIPTLYKEYGLYVNSSRAFPLLEDGLKPVERRVLLIAYQIARDKYVKSAKVDGATIGSFHPHASVYSTIVQLVHQGFLDGQGSFGNNLGVEPSPAAAERYTEVKLSKMIYEISLRLIDNVNWVESELDNEPEYFPTMFPLCLLGKEYTVGIGFGYRTLIPCYSLKDLRDRLLYLLGIKKEKCIIKPISNCKILSSEKDLQSLLTTGKAAINFQGIYKLIPQKCEAILKTWPYGKSFDKSILSKFDKELANQDIGYRDESSAENGGTHIVFEVLKQRNRDEIFKQFVKKLDDALKGSISFETVVVDGSKNVRTVSIDEMLLNTYKIYTSTNMTMLKTTKEKINDAINEIKLLEKIKPFLSKYLKDKDLEVTEIIEKISIDIKVDKEIIKDIFQKYRIMKLLTFKTDFSELEEKLKVVQDNIKNINKFVLDQYNEL
jgi:DNA gyrase subunit A